MMKPILIVVALVFIPFSMPAWAGDIEPPPALGPPSANVNSPRGYSSLFIRYYVQTAAELSMFEANKGSPHKLSWASNAEPLSCANCVQGPSMGPTTRIDRPNDMVARMTFQLAMDLDVKNLPGDRRLITPVDVLVRCADWIDGTGELEIFTRTGVPYLDGATLFEDIIDFFSPWDLSQHIDGKIKAELGPAGTGLDVQGPCVSLGTYKDQNPLYDSFVWDEPLQPSVLDFLQGSVIASANVGKVTVVLKEIRRLATPLVPDAAAPVSFDVYVNGRWIDLGGAQTGVVGVEGSVPISANRIIMPSGDLDALQVIFASSSSGAGWDHFTRSEGFGEGEQGLKTHSHVYLRSPPGIPKPLKPLPTDIREFELIYDVLRFEPAFLDASQ